MKVCDRCGSGTNVERVEVHINGRTVDRVDWCAACEQELYEFVHTVINRRPKAGFVKSTLQMVGLVK